MLLVYKKVKTNYFFLSPLLSEIISFSFSLFGSLSSEDCLSLPGRSVFLVLDELYVDADLSEDAWLVFALGCTGSGGGL